MSTATTSAMVRRIVSYVGDQIMGIAESGGKYYKFICPIPPNTYRDKFTESIPNTRLMELYGPFEPDMAIGSTWLQASRTAVINAVNLPIVYCIYVRIAYTPGDKEHLGESTVDGLNPRSSFGVNSSVVTSIGAGEILNSSATIIIDKDAGTSMIALTSKDSSIMIEGDSIRIESKNIETPGDTRKGFFFSNPITTFVKIPFLPDKLVSIGKYAGYAFAAYKLVGAAKLFKELVEDL